MHCDKVENPGFQCITPWARLASERVSEQSALVCLKLKNSTWEIFGDLQVTRFRRNRWVNCIHL